MNVRRGLPLAAMTAAALASIGSSPIEAQQSDIRPADQQRLADTTVFCGFGHCQHGTDVCCRNGGIFWCCPAGTTQCIPNGRCGRGQAIQPPAQSQAYYVIARYYCKDAATGRDAGDITSTSRGANCQQACNNARVFLNQTQQDPCSHSDHLKVLSRQQPDWIQGGACTNVHCW